jgi:hypothetical protein
VRIDRSQDAILSNAVKTGAQKILPSQGAPTPPYSPKRKASRRLWRMRQNLCLANDICRAPKAELADNSRATRLLANILDKPAFSGIVSPVKTLYPLLAQMSI